MKRLIIFIISLSIMYILTSCDGVELNLDQKEGIKTNINSEEKLETSDDGGLVSEEENIKKAMDIVKKEYNMESIDGKNFNSDLGKVTVNYEWKDEQGRYVIAIRNRKDTVIVFWCHVDLKTGEFEKEY